MQFDPGTPRPGVHGAVPPGLRPRWAFVVTSVGRITQLKDYETFIDALVLAQRQLPGVLGLIVGGVREDKQDYFRALQERVAAAGAEGYIRFTGSQSEVAEIYALSDVVVSSSKKPESFGRAAAEALAMEVPVVATGHGGVLDIVRDGETGYLFPPATPPAWRKGSRPLVPCCGCPCGPISRPTSPWRP